MMIKFEPRHIVLYCFVTLLLVYYFRMAALSWWLYLALAWFLIVYFRVNLKNVSRFSANYSHYIVWLLPALKLVFPIAFTQSGTMSELSGLCFIGDLDKNSLLNYLILPSVIYLSLGILVLILRSHLSAFSIFQLQLLCLSELKMIHGLHKSTYFFLSYSFSVSLSRFNSLSMLLTLPYIDVFTFRLCSITFDNNSSCAFCLFKALLPGFEPQTSTLTVSATTL